MFAHSFYFGFSGELLFAEEDDVTRYPRLQRRYLDKLPRRPISFYDTTCIKSLFLDTHPSSDAAIASYKPLLPGCA